MKKFLCILLLIISSTFGQTAKYPTSVPTSQDTLRAANHAATTLSGTISDNTLSITVASTASFATPTAIVIQNEIIKVCSMSGTIFTVCAGGRGFDNTTAATHTSGQGVYGYLVAANHNNLAVEIEALARHNAPVYNSIAYDFPAQAPGGSLVIGNNTITLTPCPLGVAWNATYVSFRISGGVGTDETAQLVSGGPGTCTSGLATGTITILVAGVHTGAWTITSADAGITQADRVAAAAGGTVLIPAGTHTVYSNSVISSNVALVGVSMGASIIKVADNQLPAASPSVAWGSPVDPNVLTGPTTAPAATRVRFADFTIDMNGPNQVQQPQMASLSISNGTFSTVERVRVINARHRGAMFSCLQTGCADNRFLNNVGRGPGAASAGCVGFVGPGGIFTQGPRNKIENNYVDGLCDEAYITNGPAAVDNIISGNWFIGYSTATAIHLEDSSRQTVTDNHCLGTTGACVNAAPSGALGSSMTDITIKGNHCGPGASITAPVVVTSTNAGTVVTATPHGLLAGEYTEIAGSSNAAHNGFWRVNVVVDPTTFTVLFPFVGVGAGGTSTKDGPSPSLCIQVLGDGLGHTVKRATVTSNIATRLIAGSGSGMVIGAENSLVQDNIVWGSKVGIQVAAASTNSTFVNNVMNQNTTDLVTGGPPAGTVVYPNVFTGDPSQVYLNSILREIQLQGDNTIGQNLGTAFSYFTGNLANGLLRLFTNLNPITLALLDAATPGWGIDQNAAGDIWQMWHRAVGAGAATSPISFNGATSSTVLSYSLTMTGVPFASLGAPANGTIQWCTDCLVTCLAAAGPGSWCKRAGGVWAGF